MKPTEFFAWIVSKSRPKIRLEPERPPFGIPSVYEEDGRRIRTEHIDRKYGSRELAPPGRRLHWIATNDATGQLLKGDARRQAAPISAPGSAAGPASTKKTSKAAAVERRRRIRDLKAKIAALKGRKP